MTSVDFYDEDGFFILTARVHNGFVMMTADLFTIAEYWIGVIGVSPRQPYWTITKCGYVIEMYGQGDGYIRV